MRVLYLNHTAEISGGERSLLDLLGGLPGEVAPALACPPGPLAQAARGLGVPIFGVPETVASLKLHPLHTPVGLLQLARSALSARRAQREFGAELLHANSIRAGLVAAAAARVAGAPALVQVRDCLPPGPAASLALGAIRRRAAAVVPNSEYTRGCLRFDSAGPLVEVVHSPVDLSRFDPAVVDRGTARAEFGLDDEDVALGVVAQITPWKGQEEAIRVLAALEARHPRVQLLLAGSTKFVSKATRFDNPTYLRGLHELARDLGVAERVAFLGERADVPRIMRALDLVLVPSWEEPFGRTVIEAMAMGTPVAATAVGGPAEIVSGPGEGLLLPPREPERWAAAIGDLLADPERMGAMAERGRARALAFGVPAHVDAVLGVYRRVLRRSGP